jgi:erythromycin esterase-like protein
LSAAVTHSHINVGTHEFYKVRAELTKRLIVEKGFTIVACEADWPDMYRVNRYVKSSLESEDEDADSALGNFKRFPRWMWRNEDVVEFMNWLKRHNSHNVDIRENEVGMYGLDLYSLQSSMDAVIEYLEKVDPDLAEKAKKNYACFDSMDSKQYGRKAGLGMSKTCEKEVINVLQEMLKKQATLMEESEGVDIEDAYFYAKVNAQVVRDAESYYRNLFSGRVNTWNIRDTHMLKTLVSLIDHFTERTGQTKKAVIWAHNSHLGDASQTENKRRGKINIGQLTREHYGLNKTFNIGFTTYTGSVTAADNWGEGNSYNTCNAIITY